MGKSSRNQTVTQKTDIPAFLQPFVRNQASIASSNLTRLDRELRDNPGVRPFNDFQNNAITLGANRALGEGGFFPTSENVFLNTAQGQDIGDTLDPTGVDTLRATARGDFLYGGEGFNAALDVANKDIQKRILSTFGRTGQLNGGLAQAAQAEAAADAFARLFSQERSNQLGASQALTGLADTERSRQIAAAQALPEIALAAPTALGTFGRQQQAQQEREDQARAAAFERIIGASQGTVPTSALLGSSSSQPLYSNTAGNVIGGIGLLASIAGLSNSYYKENIRPATNLTGALENVDIVKWKYLREYGDQDEHVGALAEDFHAAFGVGNANELNALDVLGVSLGIIKEQNKRIEQLESRIEELCQAD